MSKLTNLNGKYVYSTTIFKICTVYGPMKLIDISDVLRIISIRIGGKERENSIASSYMILIAKIFEFLFVCMSFGTVLITIPRIYIIILKYSNIFDAFKQLSIIFNANSNDFHLFVANDNSVESNNDTDDSSWCFQFCNCKR